jgi:monoamine oxidase
MSFAGIQSNLMHRKEFIRLAAAGLLPLSLGARGWRGAASKKVIVVGAGMAGAAAARALRNAGCQVLVLEARNRTGGRIHTHTGWGTNIELGANWIHNARHPENALPQLADTLGIERRHTSYSAAKIYDAEGDALSKLRFGLFYLRFEKQLKKYSALLRQMPADISMRQAMDGAAAGNGYTAKQSSMRALVEQAYMNNLGDELENASAQYYMNQYVRNEGHDYFVTGGYSKIIDHLLAGIDVRLSSPVLEIRNGRNSVEAVTANDVWNADHAVVTVPISLLQQGAITFSPALPEWKTKSFRAMQMGVFNKIVMEFTHKFWPGNAHFQCYQGREAPGFNIAVNHHHYTGKPMLIAMPVGEAGLLAESMDADQLQKTWTGLLHKAHPGKNIEFKNILATAWQADAYSRGSYSHVPPGATAADFEALQKETGRIYFAGEATCIGHHATVHGAYISGVREAAKILNL